MVKQQTISQAASAGCTNTAHGAEPSVNGEEMNDAGQDRGAVRLGAIGDVIARLPVSKAVVYEMARQGRFPGVVKVGRRRLFDLEALESWLEAGGEGRTK